MLILRQLQNVFNNLKKILKTFQLAIMMSLTQILQQK